MSKKFSNLIQEQIDLKNSSPPDIQKRPLCEEFNDTLELKTKQRNETMVLLSLTLGFDIRRLVKSGAVDLIIDSTKTRMSVHNIAPPYYTLKTLPMHNNVPVFKTDTIRFVVEQKDTRDHLPYFNICTLTHLGQCRWNMTFANTYNTEQTIICDNNAQMKKTLVKWLVDKGMGPTLLKLIAANEKTQMPLKKKPTGLNYRLSNPNA